ncbi:zinc finger protein 879-like [Pectinophora gossypiella]|uniref:zinc finger protein 879-like n=1 Tax=Pectinophora gossypiella TaxID=13191 RepID=UPI00214E1495|nr:zinc finger protein 879-like [Pectinophora gossypiella]
MAPLTCVVSKILSGKDDFCRLCFNSVPEGSNRLQDEVFLSSDDTANTEEIIKILSDILGKQYTCSMSTYDCICTSCLETARSSYTFIKKCQQNTELLTSAVDSLKDCIENTTTDLSSFKSLFVSIDTKDFSNKQYYDNQRPVNTCTAALVRFRSLSYGKYIRWKDSTPGVRKRRLHMYSEEMRKICDIIRDKNKTMFKCKVCDGIFNKSFNFKKHYYSQHSAKLLKCEECGKSYGSEALLKQHKYDSHASIICSECGKTYKNRYSLLYHMRQHSGEQPYECKYCGMKFQWSSRRAEHIRRFHLEPSVECNICHIKFRALGSLYEHRKRHFNPNSRLHVTQQTLPVAEEEEL